MTIGPVSPTTPNPWARSIPQARQELFAVNDAKAALVAAGQLMSATATDRRTRIFGCIVVLDEMRRELQAEIGEDPS